MRAAPRRSVPIPEQFPWKPVALAAVLIGEVALLCVIAFWGRTPPSDVMFVRSGAASLQVEGQTGPWGLVAVKRVVTPVPSWVVVQVQRQDGQGAVLGSAAVPAGATSDLNIALDPKQGAVNSVAVVLLADRGRAGVLEFSGTSAGGGGGMGMGGSSQAAASTPATKTADRPLFASGKRVAVVLAEVSRIGVPGIVRRVVVP